MRGLGPLLWGPSSTQQWCTGGTVGAAKRSLGGRAHVKQDGDSAPPGPEEPPPDAQNAECQGLVSPAARLQLI